MTFCKQNRSSLNFCFYSKFLLTFCLPYVSFAEDAKLACLELQNGQKPRACTAPSAYILLNILLTFCLQKCIFASKMFSKMFSKFSVEKKLFKFFCFTWILWNFVVPILLTLCLKSVHILQSKIFMAFHAIMHALHDWSILLCKMHP